DPQGTRKGAVVLEVRNLSDVAAAIRKPSTRTDDTGGVVSLIAGGVDGGTAGARCLDLVSLESHAPHGSGDLAVSTARLCPLATLGELREQCVGSWLDLMLLASKCRELRFLLRGWNLNRRRHVAALLGVDPLLGQAIEEGVELVELPLAYGIILVVVAA